ncbi:MAG: hypothetical protein H6733_01005 [Alphaproteobacteria bacterium]|nr:hypothetical protein [Alphaproteobacteria bacterium]
MRLLLVALAVLGLTACEVLAEDACDRYADYVCTCHPDEASECDALINLANTEMPPTDQCFADLAARQDEDEANGVQCTP